MGLSPKDIDPVRTPGNNYDLEIGNTPPQELIDMYDMNVRLSDNSIQSLIDELPDFTDLVISADHGEEFGFHTDFHSVSAFDTMARIPLIIRSPQLNRDKISSPVSLVDIPPTVCSMAGIPNVDDWVGVDLVSDIPQDRDIFIEFDEPNQVTASVVRGELKYVTRRRSINKEPFDEYLFDRSEDELERKNIIKSGGYSSDVEDLRDTLENHLNWISNNRMSTPYGMWEPNSGITGERMNQVNDSVHEQLESLGYID
jgi:arylsulfatase A-like enzyme